MSQDSYYRSAYVKMCRKNNNTRKELINKIKRADLIVVYLSIRHLEGVAGKYASYRDGIIDAFRTVYGHDDADRLWEYLGKRRERLTRLVNYILR